MTTTTTFDYSTLFFSEPTAVELVTTIGRSYGPMWKDVRSTRVSRVASPLITSLKQRATDAGYTTVGVGPMFVNRDAWLKASEKIDQGCPSVLNEDVLAHFVIAILASDMSNVSCLETPSKEQDKISNLIGDSILKLEHTSQRVDLFIKSAQKANDICCNMFKQATFLTFFGIEVTDSDESILSSEDEEDDDDDIIDCSDEEDEEDGDGDDEEDDGEGYGVGGVLEIEIVPDKKTKTD